MQCQAALQTPIRAQRRPLQAEIDGATRRPLLPLTLMRCLLSGITAFKGADGEAAQCALCPQRTPVSFRLV
ncbi:hypothetical protein JOB18_029168 [Solea senegalensis]|uniref:Uncharacterized protein n=1 Tax=Solea senegalensis TaxID=28829 RepID=A0AAV6QII8_SOLSE|nr:hypothetical protein JOB18_029168 [Solea senegalensis]